MRYFFAISPQFLAILQSCCNQRWLRKIRIGLRVDCKIKKHAIFAVLIKHRPRLCNPCLNTDFPFDCSIALVCIDFANIKTILMKSTLIVWEFLDCNGLWTFCNLDCTGLWQDLVDCTGIATDYSSAIDSAIHKIPMQSTKSGCNRKSG